MVNSNLEQCFQSVSSGKALVATAITGKGVSTVAADSFNTMANNINRIDIIQPITIGKLYCKASRRDIDKAGATADFSFSAQKYTLLKIGTVSIVNASYYTFTIYGDGILLSEKTASGRTFNITSYNNIRFLLGTGAYGESITVSDTQLT